MRLTDALARIFSGGKPTEPEVVNTATEAPKPFDPTRPLAFMHIPKTSGSSVLAGLRALGITTGAGLHDMSMFGSWSDFDSIEPELRHQVCNSPVSLRNNNGFYHGHVALSTLLEGAPEARCFTVLREPRSRLLSHWLFWRQHSDAELKAWGSWGARVREGRGPLAELLSNSLLACQIDNLAIRMLLWPHPLLPDEGFIDPVNDTTLLQQATDRLRRFDFVDIIDDGRFVERFASWIGKPFQNHHENATQSIADEIRLPLHRELTADAMQLLDDRTRLDQQLWDIIAAKHIPAVNLAKMRERTLILTIARHALLLAR